MSEITIIEVPFNLGLKEPAPGHEPGVKKLPGHLNKHGFHATLNPTQVLQLPAPPYSSAFDEASGVRNVSQIATYATEQAAILQSVLNKNQFLILLGGDCSILIGTALALKNTGRYGLFYLDGHTDYMGSYLSETGGAAGMDLAIVTGYGHENLTNLQNKEPYFKQNHVWCVGNREYDESYVNEILSSHISYIDLHQLRKEGIKACINGFLKMVQEEKLDGFWIHIDVDVLNDEIMPAVDSRQPDGLSFVEFNEILYHLLSNPKATGMQITILDPDLDTEGKYAKEFVTNICTTIHSALSHERI
ncbi:arginase family protein [Flavihumibacter sp. UBA7668]|uniref:arginase family protein n=1 Tax=Flavihumibacter sp. UBA7668 TaxID=1946542 RepID=UPI0025C50B0B|nr:arginase family protein [Flavihumibacter sp. UBA7668]